LNDISFEFAIKGITEDGYAIYRFAKSIYECLSVESLLDIYDKRLISEKNFEVIITALRICRHGLPCTGLKKNYLSQ